MPVNNTGAISIGGSTSGQSIALELGLSATGTLSMSQLYRGGTYVKPGISNSRNTSVPSSGAISLSNLYGMVRRPTININFPTGTSYTQQTVTTSGGNVTVTSLPASSGYIAGQTDINLQIPSTTTVYSNSAPSAALTFSGFSSGDEILVDNYGLISGQGGAGNAGSGGDAINYNPASAAFYPYNRSGGTIAGGGGGGGGGMASQTQYPYPPAYTYYDYNRGGGGGGGAGTNGGAGGAVRGSLAVPSGYTNYMNNLGSASAGGNGGTTSGGAGGQGDSGYSFVALYSISNYSLVYAGYGGSGGARGASGSSGTQSYFNGPQGVQYFPSGGGSITHSYYGGNVYGYAQSGYAPQSGGAAGNAIRGTAKHGQALQNSGTVLGPQVSS